MLNALYETSGQPATPLVALHNLPDHRVPFWHEVLYLFKTLSSRSTANFTPIPIPRLGHCDFTEEEALLGFALLVQKTTGLTLGGEGIPALP